jgi:hypothetical protein
MTERYGPIRVDLTPLDLYLAGYFMRGHVERGKWCWWRKNPYDSRGIGEIFGAAHGTVAEAVADARYLMAAQVSKAMQPRLLAF